MTILIIIVLLFSFTIIANAIYKKSRYYRSLNNQFFKCSTAPADTEIINIGSFPSVYCFDWSVDRTVRGFNLGIGPEEIYYDNKMLQYYHRERSDIKVVIHLITPLLFCENRYTNKLPYNVRYSVVLPKNDVRVSACAYYMEKYFPLIRKTIEAAVNRISRFKIKGNVQDVSNLTPKQQADAIMSGWLKENPGLQNFTDPRQGIHQEKFFNYQIESLKEMVEFCSKSGLTYVPVIGPVSEYIRSFFSDEFIRRFVWDNLLESSISEDSIINYYDSTDYSSMDNYTNGLFLNDITRKRFTIDVINELKRRQIL